MRRYELLLVTIPEITKDEESSLETHLDRIVKDGKGTTISFERWGKYRLAYPIRKNEYGVYYLVRFEADEYTPILKEIRSYLTVKVPTIVMRDMVTQLPTEGSLAYQRPPSLEETPARDVDSFLRENKMEGLVSKGRRFNREPREAREPRESRESKEVVKEEVAVKETVKETAPEEAVS